MMAYSMIKKLGNSCKDLNETNICKDLNETNMTMSNFTGRSTSALGVLIDELTVGSKTFNVMFFIVDGKLGYTILLDREWIHAN